MKRCPSNEGLCNYWTNENCAVGAGYPMCGAQVDVRLHNSSLVRWDSILSDNKWFYQGLFQNLTTVPNCSSHVEPADHHPNPLRKKPKVAAEWDEKTNYWKYLARQWIAVSYKLAYFLLNYSKIHNPALKTSYEHVVVQQFGVENAQSKSGEWSLGGGCMQCISPCTPFWLHAPTTWPPI